MLAPAMARTRAVPTARNAPLLPDCVCCAAPSCSSDSPSQAAASTRRRDAVRQPRAIMLGCRLPAIPWERLGVGRRRFLGTARPSPAQRPTCRDQASRDSAAGGGEPTASASRPLDSAATTLTSRKLLGERSGRLKADDSFPSACTPQGAGYGNDTGFDRHHVCISRMQPIGRKTDL